MYLLVDMVADEDAMSYIVSLTLILASAFSGFLTLNRTKEYMKNPDGEDFKPVKNAAGFMTTATSLLYIWCILAAMYWIVYNHYSGVGAIYTFITVLAAWAAVFTTIVKSKYEKAKKEYESLYLKANRGNLNALIGNPLGLDSNEQNALNSILTASQSNAKSTKTDPLNDILSGAAEIKKSTPMEAAKENLEGAAEVNIEDTSAETRECPFCKRQVEKRYRICIYCGMVIPNRDRRGASDTGDVVK